MLYELSNTGVSCPFCYWKGSCFLPAGQKNIPNRRCPECHSLERHRLCFPHLVSYLNRMKQAKILEVGKSNCFSVFFSRFKGWSYLSVGKRSDNDLLADIEHMPFPSESFDVILCFHVLEHVDNDQVALSELYRLLKQDGVLYVQIPMCKGETIEGAWLSPARRTELFGQVDHLRLYGIDINERFEKASFQVCEWPSHFLADSRLKTEWRLRDNQSCFVLYKEENNFVHNYPLEFPTNEPKVNDARKV